MDIISLLKSVSIFSQLGENLLSDLSKKLSEARYRPGELVFKENDPSDSFFIVDSGSITISKQLGAEKEKILAVLGPGSLFGEMAFFSDSPRTASAKSSADSRLWKIKRKDFLSFVSAKPDVCTKIFSGLLKVAMERLEDTSTELATVYHTGNIISSGSNLSEISSGIRDEILLALPEAEDAAIYLFNEFNEEFDPLAGPKGLSILPKGSSLAETAAKNPSGLNIGQYDGKNAEAFLKKAKSLVLSSIVKDNRMLGFIAVWNGKKFSAFKASHALLVSAVSGQLAEAVENIKHRQEEIDKQRLDLAKQTSS